MWIICAGSKRSGSTLQYNLISKIVEISNSGIRVPFHKQEDHHLIYEKYSKIKGFKVIKTHIITDEIKKLIETDQSIIFHCYRDIRDVVVSYINKGWITKNIEDISKLSQNYINEYNTLSEYSNNNFYSRKYEDFAFNIENELKYIQQKLGITLDAQVIQKIALELDKSNLLKFQKSIPEEEKVTEYNQIFNKTTLLHNNHINDGSMNQFLKLLNNEEIITIEKIAWLWLLNHNYSLYWSKTDLFLSFSQHGDDYLAWQLLNKSNNGVIIEVGAFDGVHLSNSFSLEQKGWKSINIEPTPKVYKALEKNRPNSKNINCAIVGNEEIKEIDFYSEEIGVLSGCSFDEDDIKRRYKNRGLDYTPPKQIKVKANTLNSIFKSENITSIDIISIDVEGFELEVLKGLNLNTYNVGLFIIEANNNIQKNEILNFFKNFSDYLFLGNNHQNLFIANKNIISKKILRNLDYNKYIPAKQYHTLNHKLSIDSIKLKFEKSKECKTLQKYWLFF